MLVYSIFKNGKITVVNKIEYSFANEVTGKIFLKAGTYIISLQNIECTNENMIYVSIDIGDVVTGLNTTSAKKNITFTLDNDKWLNVKTNVLGTYIGTVSFNVQIEEGDTVTEYELYKGSIKTLYLNSPLLEGDTIEEKDNGIYHVHRYEEVVLDGSDDEEWYLSTSNGFGNYFTMYAVNNGDNSKFRQQLSDKLIAGVNPYSEEGTDIIGVVGSQIRLRISNITRICFIS